MTNWRALFAVTAASALLLTGCTQDITGTAVTAAGGAPDPSGGSEDQCATVAAPLDDIPNEDDSEPLLRIPVPDGWERNSMMDSPVIRYTIVSTDLISNDFAPNAVVTLESVRGSQASDEVFEQNRANLESGLGAFDLQTESNTTCGLPSETTVYMAPPMGPAPERPIIMHAVVAEDGGSTFLATLTIQTTDPDDPRYVADSQEIVDGFQMLLPGS
ncbi:LpqN/LpqT family lipoprotein [Mycobacterium sp. 236(2023)]|uniref:LpqN/LpqT family lipoprotein n=1 Tax=Mycobacterium sp. 236(2023) TaxID=3038163 RepID=UPI0024154B82|nr:LpqN/LpqT family lipoprotein [Mycobacterium sp. 236(2023)]MDG4663443.1 LpqN/LpqT family lipoprotein [Mycobacterium sp. 236(2023)]